MSQQRSSTTDCANCHQPVGYHQWRVSVGPHLTFHYPECARCVLCSEPVRSGSLVTVQSTGVVCISHQASIADTYESTPHEVDKLILEDLTPNSKTETNSQSQVISEEISFHGCCLSVTDNTGISQFIEQPFENNYHNTCLTRQSGILRDPSIKTTLNLKLLSMNTDKLELVDQHFLPNCLHAPMLIDHSANTVTSTAAHGRLRTVINKRQLTTLRTCYSINSRPDSLTKQRLAQMTGLPPRVIRVWFQNKRCSDKKRRFRSLSNSTKSNGVDSNSTNA
ncbi:hypothetical protein PHET_02100 [Paragonimus heterotremus]|uniref:Homeobox domain-containing protein n=1 Tax=Paragonimus heterotremus TaxID=100268 RepID=A0A8J4WJ13_9TREM|nr:hypothetical protein PHET_02100 [Paragonimus heterotremus]